MTRTTDFRAGAAPGNVELAAPSLANLDEQFADLVEQIAPSVVHIRQDQTVRRGNGTMTVPSSQGSGVIYTNDGWIVTNDHVVNGATEVTVVLWNGREYRGRVVESNDDRNDIAVVKIDARNLQPAKFADSDLVRPGQYALAVGAPFGLENSVTIGHISATGRDSVAGDGQRSIQLTDMIQTDAPINPGNSGGPLINIRGEVVGINQSIFSGMSFMGQGQNAGIGFAVPSNQAKFIADMLRNNREIQRGYLNIVMEPLKPFELEELGVVGGVRVEQPVPGGAAARAGIQAGDIITRVGSFTIRRDQDLLNAMLRYRPGQRVDVQILRNKQPRTVSVQVDSQLNQSNMRMPQQQPQMPRGEERGPRTPGFEWPNFEEWFNRDRENRPNGQNRQERTPQGERGSQSQQPARLGVELQEISTELRQEFGVPQDARGALIVNVEPGSVADNLGLQAGDLIVRLGDREIGSPADLRDAIGRFRVGDISSITVRRWESGAQMEMTRSVQF